MKINNLYFAYRTKQPLLKGLNLHLEAGRIYGLLGKNGSGKTTLLKIMAGLCFPDAGEIQAFSFQPQRRQPQFLEQLFFIPEDFSLPALSVQKYAELYGVFYPHFDHALFKKALQLFELNPQSRLPNLSHGQKKLFLTAFGLATRVALLILDEPSNGLDIQNKQAWQSLLLQEITAQQCVIISTHQVQDIDHLIDTVLILHEGKIALHATLQDLETQLYCGMQAEAPPADSVFYTELRAGGHAVLRQNQGEAPTAIDLSLLFQATLNHSALSHLFSGASHV